MKLVVHGQSDDGATVGIAGRRPMWWMLVGRNSGWNSSRADCLMRLQAYLNFIYIICLPDSDDLPACGDIGTAPVESRPTHPDHHDHHARHRMISLRAGVRESSNRQNWLDISLIWLKFIALRCPVRGARGFLNKDN